MPALGRRLRFSIVHSFFMLLAMLGFMSYNIIILTRRAKSFVNSEEFININININIQ